MIKSITLNDVCRMIKESIKEETESTDIAKFDGPMLKSVGRRRFANKSTRSKVPNRRFKNA